jgi:hypothetical protein
MSASHRAHPIPVPLFLATGLAILLASCATLVPKDDLPRDAEKGWVVFVSDREMPLRISRVTLGNEDAPFDNRTSRQTPVAVACPPGRNDFVVRDRDHETRVAVPVARGMVTYVGVRMQVIAEEPQTTYHTRVSVGTHPLPFEAKAKDPAPLVTGLVDRDWATRWAAARALERISPPLEPSATPLLTDLARDDPHELVRAAARRALASAGKPSPTEPLLFISFEQSADGWPLGEGLASVTSLVPEGYLLAVKDAEGTAWRVRSAGNAVTDRGNLDVLLECRWLGGNGTTGYGLTLGSGSSSFNAFCVSRSGGATAVRFINGREASAPLPWTSVAAAAITGTPVTRIEVAKRGSRYEVTVNGEPVGAFDDGTGLAVTHLGVFVDDAQSVVFRKIVVTAR